MARSSAMTPDGRPQPFQVTARRFGRKLDLERMRAELPLTPFWFDLLYLDGQSLIDEPQSRRFSPPCGTCRRPARLVPSPRHRRSGTRRRIPAPSARSRQRRHHGQSRRCRLRRRRARPELAENQEGPHARPGDSRRRMGQRPPAGLAEQPPPRRARYRKRRLRHAGQNLQRPDRRNAAPGRPRNS